MFSVEEQSFAETIQLLSQLGLPLTIFLLLLFLLLLFSFRIFSYVY